MKKLFYYIFLLLAPIFSAQAQEIIEIEPLFEYPMAPENIEGLDKKCDYLVKHFWDKFDFKNKKTLDQHALNSAFGVYVTSMQYASKKEADASIDKLISKISGNPSLSIQFMKAAEEKLYGPRADVWIDEIYLKFLDSFLKNKKVDNSKKTKYRNQYNTLTSSTVGTIAPSFEFADKDGVIKTYFPMSTPTVLILGNPSNTDWQIERLKMETNLKFKEALEKGKVNLLFIIPAHLENWQNMVGSYNPKITVGESTQAGELYDHRLDPSIFFIGSEGKILNKMITLSEAIDLSLNNMQQ